jgi:3-methyladenine DNA glycosylase AlkD
MRPIRSIAKELAKSNRWSPQTLGNPTEDQYHEEKLVRFLALAYATIEEEERLVLLESMLDYLDNWALCDSLSSTLKETAKYPTLYRDFIRRHLYDKRPYACRFAIVLILNHFMTPIWIEDNLALLEQVKRDHYYIRMAVAWAVATAFTVSPSVVFTWFETTTMDIETLRMAGQKIRDSKRVSPEDKKRTTALLQSKKYP